MGSFEGILVILIVLGFLFRLLDVSNETADALNEGLYCHNKVRFVLY